MHPQTFGQFYTMCSRVRRIEDLHLRNFDPSKIIFSKWVVSIYEEKDKESSEFVNTYSGEYYTVPFLSYVAGVLRRFPIDDLAKANIIRDSLQRAALRQSTLDQQRPPLNQNLHPLPEANEDSQMTDVWEEVKDILEEEEKEQYVADDVMMIDTSSTNKRGQNFNIVKVKKKRTQ